MTQIKNYGHAIIYRTCYSARFYAIHIWTNNISLPKCLTRIKEHYAHEPSFKTLLCLLLGNRTFTKEVKNSDGNTTARTTFGSITSMKPCSHCTTKYLLNPFVDSRINLNFQANYSSDQRSHFRNREKIIIFASCFILPTQRLPTFYAKDSSPFPIMLKGQPIRDPHSFHACSGGPWVVIISAIKTTQRL